MTLKDGKCRQLYHTWILISVPAAKKRISIHPNATLKIEPKKFPFHQAHYKPFWGKLLLIRSHDGKNKKILRPLQSSYANVNVDTSKGVGGKNTKTSHQLRRKVFPEGQITGWPLVGNEGMKLYMVMMGIHEPSFPTNKGQPDKWSNKNGGGVPTPPQPHKSRDPLTW